MAANPSIFVTKIPAHLFSRLQEDLTQQGFSFIDPSPAFTTFAAKKTGISCTLYTSGKLVIQGKQIKDFIEFYLEPELLGSFAFSFPSSLEASQEVFTPHIGIDESGKGDVFGALCVAGVFASHEHIEKLRSLKVADSKSMTDTNIRRLAPQIHQLCPSYILKISPYRYNELYEKFLNLNHLLAWGHATVIEELVKKTNCKEVLIDQFAAEHVVERALRLKNLDIHLRQQHRAESDAVVAAASILARYAFLKNLDRLSQEYGVTLPKGASSQTVQVAKEFIRKNGRPKLAYAAKIHFKSISPIFLGEL